MCLSVDHLTPSLVVSALPSLSTAAQNAEFVDDFAQETPVRSADPSTSWAQTTLRRSNWCRGPHIVNNCSATEADGHTNGGVSKQETPAVLKVLKHAAP
jgi:hypothetical protein